MFCCLKPFAGVPKIDFCFLKLFVIVFLKLFGMFVVFVGFPKTIVVLLADSYVSLCNFGSSLETLLAERYLMLNTQHLVLNSNT